MPKEAAAAIGLELSEGGSNGRLQVGEGPGGSLAQMRFEFGEGHLDGIEVGTVGRKVAGGGSAGLNESYSHGSFVDAEVVEDDNAACDSPELRQTVTVVLQP